MNGKKVLEAIIHIGCVWFCYVGISFLIIMSNGGKEQMSLNIKQAVIDLNLVSNPFMTISVIFGIVFVIFGASIILGNELGKTLTESLKTNDKTKEVKKE